MEGVYRKQKPKTITSPIKARHRSPLHTPRPMTISIQPQAAIQLQSGIASPAEILESISEHTRNTTTKTSRRQTVIQRI